MREELVLAKKIARAPSRQQTLRNVFSIWANRVFAILVPLVTTPLIINKLGLETAGIWFLATQLAGHLMLLDAGIVNSLVRLLARPKASDSLDHVVVVLVSAVLPLSGIGFLLLLLSPFIGDFFFSFFEIPPQLKIDGLRVFTLATISVAVVLPLRSGYSLLTSQHRIDIVQLSDAIWLGVRLLLIVLEFLYGDPTIFTLGLIVFGTVMGASMTTFIIGFRMRSDLTTKIIQKGRSGFSSIIFGELISMSFAMLLVTFSAIALFQGSSSLVGFFLNLKSLSLLALPMMIFVSIIPFFQTFSTIAAPIAAGISSEGEKDELKTLYMETTKYLASFSGVTVAGIIFFGEILLNLWLVGPSVTPEDVHLIWLTLIVVLFGYAIGSPAILARSILTSTGHHWVSAIVELATSIAGVAIGVALLLSTELQTLGMAIGIASTLVMRGLFLYVILIARYFSCSSAEILSRTLVYPALITAGTVFVGVFVPQFLPEMSLFSIPLGKVVGGLLAMSIWMLLTWKIIFGIELKKYVWEKISNYI